MRERSQFPYIRLPGTLRGFIRKASLWEGTDHVLSVTGTRFSEDYRRFRYRDIETIIIQKGARAGSIGWWLTSILACVIAISIGVASSGAIAWTIACLFILFVLCRLVISVRYSCRCYIQTAVSREELPSLLRIWTARKTLERLRNKIAEAQGVLPDEIADLREAAETTKAPSTLAQAAAEGGANATNTNAGGKSASLGFNLAVAAFVLLLVDAADSFWFLDAPSRTLTSTWFGLLTMALVLAEGLAVVLALLTVYKLRTLRPIRNLLFAALAFVAAEVWFSLYFRQFYTAEAMLLRGGPTFDHVWHWVQLIAGSVAILLGAGGLLLVLLQWQTYRRGDLSTA